MSTVQGPRLCWLLHFPGWRTPRPPGSPANFSAIPLRAPEPPQPPPRRPPKCQSRWASHSTQPAACDARLWARGPGRTVCSWGPDRGPDLLLCNFLEGTHSPGSEAGGPREGRRVSASRWQLQSTERVVGCSERRKPAQPARPLLRTLSSEGQHGGLPPTAPMFPARTHPVMYQPHVCWRRSLRTRQGRASSYGPVGGLQDSRLRGLSHLRRGGRKAVCRGSAFTFVSFLGS